MDTKILGGSSNINLPSYGGVPLPAKQASATPAPAPAPEIKHSENNFQGVEFGIKQAGDEARYEAVKQAAVKFNYPLGDKTFTIYRDTSGQYITVYTSLRDGSVTQIPEPQMLSKASGGRTGLLFETQA